MLLIPLLLLWAREPMHFAGRWKTSLIAVTTAIVLTAPLAGSGPGAGPAAAAAGSGSEADRTTPGLLREGTRIPATTGRFAIIGSRWNFVPEPPSTPNPSAPNPSAPNPPAGGPSASPNSSLARPTETSSSGSGPSRGEQAGEAAPPRQTAGATTGERPQARRPRRRMIVTENLMLQRVVEAIRADKDDTRWTVTGEVTEFFGENRLQLHTVQRASGG